MGHRCENSTFGIFVENVEELIWNTLRAASPWPKWDDEFYFFELNVFFCWHRALLILQLLLMGDLVVGSNWGSGDRSARKRDVNLRARFGFNHSEIDLAESNNQCKQCFCRVLQAEKRWRRKWRKSWKHTSGINQKIYPKHSQILTRFRHETLGRCNR